MGVPITPIGASQQESLGDALKSHIAHSTRYSDLKKCRDCYQNMQSSTYLHCARSWNAEGVCVVCTLDKEYRHPHFTDTDHRVFAAVSGGALVSE